MGQRRRRSDRNLNSTDGPVVPNAIGLDVEFVALESDRLLRSTGGSNHDEREGAQ